MQDAAYYRDIANRCIAMTIHQLVSEMQHYNAYVHKDNRSAGLYNAQVQNTVRLIKSFGFQPNIKQVTVQIAGEYYVVYKSLDFEHHSIQLRDLGVTEVIGNSGIDNTIHEFTYEGVELCTKK